MPAGSTVHIARFGGALTALAVAAVLVLVTATGPQPAHAAQRKPTPTPIATPIPTASPTSSPVADFAFGTNYGPSFGHYLIRGETWDPHPLCNNCVTYGGPHVLSSSFGSCFFDANSISVVSRNGFSGTVQLEMLGLPVGVTSRTAASLTVQSGTSPSASTGFRLEASTAAASGTFTATIQGTSGTITHSVSLPISVVDQLPNC
jgi:hypothetical protein